MFSEDDEDGSNLYHLLNNAENGLNALYSFRIIIVSILAASYYKQPYLIFSRIDNINVTTLNVCNVTR